MVGFARGRGEERLGVGRALTGGPLEGVGSLSGGKNEILKRPKRSRAESWNVPSRASVLGADQS